MCWCVCGGEGGGGAQDKVCCRKAALTALVQRNAINKCCWLVFELAGATALTNLHSQETWPLLGKVGEGGGGARKCFSCPYYIHFN